MFCLWSSLVRGECCSESRKLSRCSDLRNNGRLLPTVLFLFKSLRPCHLLCFSMCSRKVARFFIKNFQSSLSPLPAPEQLQQHQCHQNQQQYHQKHQQVGHGQQHLHQHPLHHMQCTSITIATSTSATTTNSSAALPIPPPPPL
ncbi:hypothetical protein RRG08_002832 [Elysia crispata]|uniref:Uncharacterized protein n=1 Tax=Elysia crispata TaxID=231223 RepID=A0AAE0XU09_9GAST|nr:hypothetical protein RRG08_002832 [Elysia crispata]